MRFNELLQTSYEASRNNADFSKTVLSIKNLAEFTKERTALKVIGTPNLNTTKTNTESALTRITSNTRRSILSKRSVTQTDRKQHSIGCVEDCVSSPKSSIRVRTNVLSEQRKRIKDVISQIQAEEIENAPNDLFDNNQDEVDIQFNTEDLRNQTILEEDQKENLDKQNNSDKDQDEDEDEEKDEVHDFD